MVDESFLVFSLDTANELIHLNELIQVGSSYLVQAGITQSLSLA